MYRLTFVCVCVSRFVGIRAGSVCVREFNKATFTDYDQRALASSDAAAAAACHQVMLSHVVGDTVQSQR